MFLGVNEMGNNSDNDSSWSSALQRRLQSGGSISEEINWNNQRGYSVDFIKRLEHLLVHKRLDDEKPSQFSDQSRGGMFTKELVLEVEKYQHETGLNDIDGKLGDETLDSLKWTYPSLNEGLEGDGIVDRVIIPNDTNESDLYDYLNDLVIERLGEWKSDKMEVNLVGIRGFSDGKQVDNIPNEYNDTIFISFVDENDNKCVKNYVVSVDPGVIETPRSGNARLYGLGHLKDGTYIYKLDWHRRPAPSILKSRISRRISEGKPVISVVDGNYPKYRALRAKTNCVRVYRDKDNDAYIGIGEIEKEFMAQSVNIHCSGNQWRVGGWSEGCQIIQEPEDYIEFILLIEKSLDQLNIPYTLVDSSKIDAM